MICGECGLDKLLVADRGKKVRRCIDCSRTNYIRSQRQYYKSNQDSIKARTIVAQADRLSAWVDYFKTIYGLIPSCACCGRSLQWPGESKNKSESVHFDHRHGGVELIKSSPTKWFRSRQPTEQNKQIFSDCDFGLLCTDCNRCLPTTGRGFWLQQALEYHDKSKT